MNKIRSIPFVVFGLFASCQEEPVTKIEKPSFEITSDVVTITSTTNTFTGVVGDVISFQITGKTPGGFGSLDFEVFQDAGNGYSIYTMEVDYSGLQLDGDLFSMAFSYTLTEEFFNSSTTNYLRIRLTDTGDRAAEKRIRIVHR